MQAIKYDRCNPIDVELGSQPHCAGYKGDSEESQLTYRVIARSMDIGGEKKMAVGI